MASTYSSTLNLELQASGENSGTWGTITNNNLQKLESAIKGYVSVAIASTSDSLSATDGTTADETSNAIIKLTGTLTGNTTMQCEAVENWYIVDNAATMGTYTLGFKPAGGTAASLVSGSKHLLYSDGSTMFDVLDDAGNITANGTLDVTGNVNFNGGTFIYNEAGADLDARFEGASDANLLYLDAGNDRVGIGIPSGAAPNGKLEIDQYSSSAAIAVLTLDQADADQEFINFQGTTASDQTSSLTTDTSVGSLTGHIRIAVNGTDYWIPYYATN